MASVGLFGTELKTCVIRLRRIGNAESETIEIQHRLTVPALGEVIEVSVGEAIVRARVTQVSAAAADAMADVTIDVDELSSGYLWETLIELTTTAASRLARPPFKSPSGLVCRESSILRDDGGRFMSPPPSRLEARSRLGA